MKSLLVPLTAFVLAAPAYAAIDVIPTPERFNPAERARDLADKLSYANEHHYQIWPWLAAAVGVVIAALCVYSLIDTGSTARRAIRNR